MKKPIKHSELISKKILVSNDYASGKIEFDSSTKSLGVSNIFYEFLDRLNDKNWDQPISIPLKECIDFTKQPDMSVVDPKNIFSYSRYKKFADEIQKTTFVFDYSTSVKKGVKAVSLFEESDVASPISGDRLFIKDGAVTLKLNPKLYKLFVNVANNAEPPKLLVEGEPELYHPKETGFSEFDYYALKSIGSVSARTTYEKLARYKKNYARFVYPIDKYRNDHELVNIKTGRVKYEKPSMLMKNHIQKDITEINLYSDLNISAQFDKPRKPTSIIYSFNKSLGQHVKAFTSDPNRLENLKKINASREDIKKQLQKPKSSSKIKKIELKNFPYSSYKKSDPDLINRISRAGLSYQKVCKLDRREVAHILDVLFTLNKVPRFFEIIYQIKSGELTVVSNPRKLVLTIVENEGAPGLVKEAEKWRKQK